MPNSRKSPRHTDEEGLLRLLAESQAAFGGPSGVEKWIGFVSFSNIQVSNAAPIARISSGSLNGSLVNTVGCGTVVTFKRTRVGGANLSLIS
jgi:hypothetical protein